jgi:hypothetical protein
VVVPENGNRAIPEDGFVVLAAGIKARSDTVGTQSVHATFKDRGLIQNQSK